MKEEERKLKMSEAHLDIIDLKLAVIELNQRLWFIEEQLRQLEAENDKD